jgi:hypothetical protein
MTHGVVNVARQVLEQLGSAKVLRLVNIAREMLGGCETLIRPKSASGCGISIHRRP